MLFDMKILRKFTSLLLISIVCLWCFADASWKDKACVVGGSCNDVSSNYKEPYCFSNEMGEDATSYLNNCLWVTLTNALSCNWGTWEELSKLSKKDLIKNYCLSLYWDSANWRIYFAKPNVETSDWDWQQTFDSHQSLFLYAFCSSFTQSWNNHPFVNNDNALVKDVFTGNLVKVLNLEQMSDWKDLCSLDEDLSKCDMSIYATKIYTAIMSDLYKIKYAQVLNVDTSKNFSLDRKSKIEDFMAWYSLSKVNVAEKYEDLKSYASKTVSILRSNQMNYKNVLDTVKVIDNSMLAKKSKEVWCSSTWNMIWVDFVACALHSSQKNKLASTASFLTLVYNEILHYRQFVVYFTSWSEKKDQEINREWMDLKWYSNLQIDSTKSVQQDFQDFSVTYPLHISILMYMERIENFRNTNLSKIITSFYSLSEKLQNVQEPSS